MHVIAAKAVALHEALQPEFAEYARRIVDNAKALAATLAESGLDIVSGGTDSHLLLVDLRPLGLTGRDAEQSLERAGITANKNAIPFDPQKPTVTSGVRLGSPAATTRGFGTEEFRTIGRWIVEVLRALARRPSDHPAIESRVRGEVREMCARFPIYRAAR
jgi:glycine hydroxymethyltransferase